MSEWIAVIVVLIGAPLTTIIANRLDRPKVKADVAETYNQMALQLVTPQAKRIDELEKQVGNCTLRIDQFEHWAKLLAAQILELGQTPITFEEAKEIHMHRRSTDR